MTQIHHPKIVLPPKPVRSGSDFSFVFSSDLKDWIHSKKNILYNRSMKLSDDKGRRRKVTAKELTPIL